MQKSNTKKRSNTRKKFFKYKLSEDHKLNTTLTNQKNTQRYRNILREESFNYTKEVPTRLRSDVLYHDIFVTYMHNVVRNEKNRFFLPIMIDYCGYT